MTRRRRLISTTWTSGIDSTFHTGEQDKTWAQAPQADHALLRIESHASAYAAPNGPGVPVSYNCTSRASRACKSRVRPVAKIAGACRNGASPHPTSVNFILYADQLAVSTASCWHRSNPHQSNDMFLLATAAFANISASFDVPNCCDSSAYRKPVISICMREVVCLTRQANFLVQPSLQPLWGPFSRASLAPAPPCQALLTFLASYRPRRLRLVTQNSAAAHLPIGEAFALHVVD